MLWKEGKKKALTLSYDDAVVHDRRFIELLNKYGITCTFNLVSGWFEDEKIVYDYDEMPIEEHKHVKVSKDEVKSLYKDFEVASHTVNHPRLVGMSLDEVNYEVNEDVNNLENIMRTDVRGFAYPYGAYDEELMGRLKNCGIVYARTVNSTHGFGLPEDFLAWHPTCHHDDPELMNLAKRFIESENEGDLFYLWGHSYEFYINNNWDHIEEFLKYVSQYKDQIWFATNIEIYDYVQSNK